MSFLCYNHAVLQTGFAVKTFTGNVSLDNF